MVFSSSTQEIGCAKVAVALSRILGDEFSCENSLDNISATLNHYVSDADTYQVAQTIDFMLRHPDMLPTKHQKATALFLMYELFKSEPLYFNPFAHVFVEMLDNQSPMSLRIFCSHLANVHGDLGDSPASSVLHEMLRKTPKILVHEFESLSSQAILDTTSFLSAVGTKIISCFCFFVIFVRKVFQYFPLQYSPIRCGKELWSKMFSAPFQAYGKIFLKCYHT